MITCITCTGHRPEAFKLCRDYLIRQTYNDSIQWIVIDDSPQIENLKPLLKSLPKHITPELYAGPKMWTQGVNTLRGNLEVAVPHIQGDKIFLIEDDDAYDSHYLEAYSQLLNHSAIVGESNSKYFNLLVPGWIEKRNYKHSSLCQTAFHKSALPLFVEALNTGHLFIDVVFWTRAIEKRVPMLLMAEQNLCIGIKGMPGRENLSLGHKIKGYTYDGKLAKLQEWVGSDVELYRPFIRKYTNEKESKINAAPGLQSRKTINNGATGNIKQQSRSNSGIGNTQSKPSGQAQKPAPQASKR